MIDEFTTLTLDPGWSRHQVQNYLLARGFTLTSNDDDSTIESIISCLLQHHLVRNNHDNSNCCRFWLSSVKDIIKSVVLEEKNRIPILIELNGLKHQCVGKDLAFDQLIELAKNFVAKHKLFQSPMSVECLGKQGGNFPIDSIQQQKIVLWHNTETGSVDNIVLRRLLFENGNDYLGALLQDFRRIRNCFFQKIKDSSEVKNEAFKYATELKKCFSPRDYLDKMGNDMDEPATFVLKQIEAELSRSGRKRLTEEMERDLREEIAVSLSTDVDDVLLLRRAEYDKKYLAEMNRKNQLQLENKAMQLAMKLLEGKVKKNDHFMKTVFWRWRRFSKKKRAKREQPDHDSSANLKIADRNLDKRTWENEQVGSNNKKIDAVIEGVPTVENNQRKWVEEKQQLAWMMFQNQLQSYIPLYKLLTEPSQDIIDEFLCVNEPLQLVQTVLDKLETISCSDKVSLDGYVTKNADQVRDKIHDILENLFREPQWSRAVDQSFHKVTGSALILSKIKEQLPAECEEIQICASKVIYLDCNWTSPGMNFVLSAPIISTRDEISSVVINTSGEDAKEHQQKKADNGKREGESGDHGCHSSKCPSNCKGGAGGHAGHVFIECDTLRGEVKIKACGGNGVDGQSGGDGQDGTKGEDGVDGVLDGSHSEGWGIWNRRFRSKDGLLTKVDGTEGTPGQNGGNGGNAGAGGQGGKGGQVQLKITNGLPNCIYENEDGKSGANGEPGEGGEGGGGGVNGLTRAKAFDIEGCWFTGNWVEKVGDLTFQEQKSWLGNVIGYKIDKKGDSKGYASKGQKGQRGEAADTKCNANATNKKAIANVESLWAPAGFGQDEENQDSNIKNESKEAENSNEQTNGQQEEEQVDSKKSKITLGTMMAEIAINRKRKEHLERQFVALEYARTSASFKENAEKMEGAELNLEQLGQELQEIESLSQVPEQILTEIQQVNQRYELREQRIAELDQAVDGQKSDVETLDIDITTPIIAIPEENEFLKGKTGLQLLDALVSNLAADVHKSEPLASIVQQLAMRLKNGKGWTSVTNIIRPILNNLEEMIQALKWINADIELVNLFDKNKETKLLLNSIRKAVKEKLGHNHKGNEVLDDTSVFFYLRKLSWNPQDVKGMLQSVERISTINTNVIHAKCRLKDTLCSKLMSSIVSKQNKKEDATWLEDFLTSVLECYIADKPDQQVALLFDDFIQELSSDTKHIRSTLDTKAKSMLYDLAMRELKLNKEGKGASDATTMKKILFSLRYSGKPVEVMDTYSKLILSDVQLAKSVNKIFHDHIWTPEWETIVKKLTHFDSAIQQSTQEMKTILELKYCRCSYKDKLAICQKIMLQLNDDDDTHEKIVQLLEEVRLAVIGTFVDISGRDDKEKFLNFLFSINTNTIKSAYKRFIKGIQDKFGSEHAEALENRMKHAIHLYDKLVFNTHELVMIHGIILEIGSQMTAHSLISKEMINIWKDFKEIHDQHWMGNFLRNWITKNNVTEKYRDIDSIKDEIQIKWQRHCVDGARSRIAEPNKVIRRMDFLLERLMLLTSEYASIDQSLSIWQELKETKPQLLEDEIKKRSKLLIETAGTLKSSL